MAGTTSLATILQHSFLKYQYKNALTIEKQCNILLVLHVRLKYFLKLAIKKT